MSNIIYKITIEQTRLEEKISPREWVKLGPEDGEDNGYGYAPQVIETKNVTREIYTQVVTSLDLPSVIATINKLSKDG